MRHELRKKLLNKEFTRGNHALAVIKNGEVVKISTLDAYREDIDNQEILDAAIEHKAKIYKVQFLSPFAISSSFAMDLDHFYKKHSIQN